ncbi:hypothetical protein [Actinoplanes rectilineatus]|uniref:hypothetical protein n=1 Tax=Actinoplanes rectilineatus TaxID=113571 RepID=UPI000AAE556B|nr:hypothetical protein [Actinoplanes rectilineatus]
MKPVLPLRGLVLPLLVTGVLVAACNNGIPGVVTPAGPPDGIELDPTPPLALPATSEPAAVTAGAGGTARSAGQGPAHQGLGRAAVERAVLDGGVTAARGVVTPAPARTTAAPPRVTATVIPSPTTAGVQPPVPTPTSLLTDPPVPTPANPNPSASTEATVLPPPGPPTATVLPPSGAPTPTVSAQVTAGGGGGG